MLSTYIKWIQIRFHTATVNMSFSSQLAATGFDVTRQAVCTHAKRLHSFTCSKNLLSKNRLLVNKTFRGRRVIFTYFIDPIRQCMW